MLYADFQIKVGKATNHFNYCIEEINKNPELVKDKKFVDSFFEAAYLLDEVHNDFYHCEIYRGYVYD